MIARASHLFLPTLREPPADAEAVNHKLLVRGGFVRQVTGGVWTFLPLGWKVHRKVEQIIREEMDAIGCSGDADAGPDAVRAVADRPAATTSRRSSASRIARAPTTSCR